jgi:hypothetical protein
MPKKPHDIALPPDVVLPILLPKLLGIHGMTRHRHERAGKIPARNFIVNGRALGWKPATVRRMLRERTP